MNCELLSVPARILSPILQRTCYYPKDLTIRETLFDGGVHLLVLPHAADCPILIGKQGRQIDSLRQVARVIGRNAGVHCDLSIRDSFIGEKERRQFIPAEDFPRVQFVEDLKSLCGAVFGVIPPMEARDGNDRIIVTLDVPGDQVALVNAIADMFYPYGFRNGRKLSIRTKDYEPVKA